MTGHPLYRLAIIPIVLLSMFMILVGVYAWFVLNRLWPDSAKLFHARMVRAFLLDLKAMNLTIDDAIEYCDEVSRYRTS